MKDDSFSHESLCSSCDVKPCCTSCESPFLFSKDIENLEKLGKSNEEFIETIQVKGKLIKTLKKKQGTTNCIFWNEKKNCCSIYNHRPFDCKIFPFDIIKVGTKFHWIVFSCNPNSDWSWTNEHLNQIEADPQFLEIIQNLDPYASFFISNLSKESAPRFTILREVSLFMDLIIPQSSEAGTHRK